MIRVLLCAICLILFLNGSEISAEDTLSSNETTNNSSNISSEPSKSPADNTEASIQNISITTSESTTAKSVTVIEQQEMIKRTTKSLNNDEATKPMKDLVQRVSINSEHTLASDNITTEDQQKIKKTTRSYDQEADRTTGGPVHKLSMHPKFALTSETTTEEEEIIRTNRSISNQEPDNLTKSRLIPYAGVEDIVESLSVRPEWTFTDEGTMEIINTRRLGLDDAPKEHLERKKPSYLDKLTGNLVLPALNAQNRLSKAWNMTTHGVKNVGSGTYEAAAGTIGFLGSAFSAFFNIR